MKKTMKFVSIATANKILVNSLFNPVNGKSLVRMKYETAKYKPRSFKVGMEVEVLDDVHAIYASNGRDQDGAYQRIMCITER